MTFEFVQIPKQINMEDENWLEQLEQSGQANDLFKQYQDREQLKRNILSGLNMGNQYISEMQDLNNVRKPQTQEEIQAARQGIFNNPASSLQNALSASAQKTPNGLQSFAAGYRDNYDNAFSATNLANDPNKNWSYRLGEGLGTVGRFIDSPLGRGLIAGGLNSALGYDNSLQEGLQAFAGRQNAVTADKLYRRQLKDYGYSDEDLGQIRGNITTDMYKNLANNLYRTKNLDQNTYIKMKKVYDTQLQMGILSPEQYQANVEALNNQYINGQIQTMQAGEVQESNQTRNTDSQIGYRNKRLEQYDQQLALIDKRIAQVGANAAARLGLMQQRLDLQQKREAEKQQRDKEEAQDLAEFQQIFSGKDKGAKDYARNAYIKKYGKDPMKKLELY